MEQEKIIRLLREEMVVAMGCTEPAASALARMARRNRPVRVSSPIRAHRSRAGRVRSRRDSP